MLRSLGWKGNRCTAIDILSNRISTSDWRFNLCDDLGIKFPCGFIINPEFRRYLKSY